MNLGPCICQAGASQLSYIPNPEKDTLEAFTLLKCNKKVSNTFKECQVDGSLNSLSHRKFTPAQASKMVQLCTESLSCKYMPPMFGVGGLAPNYRGNAIQRASQTRSDTQQAGPLQHASLAGVAPHLSTPCGLGLGVGSDAGVWASKLPAQLVVPI